MQFKPELPDHASIPASLFRGGRGIVVRTFGLSVVMLAACSDSSQAPTASRFPAERPVAPVWLAEQTIESQLPDGRVAAIRRVVQAGESDAAPGDAVEAMATAVRREVQVASPEATPAGISRVAFRDSTGRTIVMRVTRAEAGAPASRVEVHIDGVPTAVVTSAWHRQGRTYSLESMETQRYASGKLQARFRTTFSIGSSLSSREWMPTAAQGRWPGDGVASAVSANDDAEIPCDDVEDGSNLGQRMAGGTHPISARVMECTAASCWREAGAAAGAGAVASVLFGLIPAGALGTFYSGGLLAPAAAGAIGAWVLAEAVFMEKVGALVDCLNKKE